MQADGSTISTEPLEGIVLVNIVIQCCKFEEVWMKKWPPAGPAAQKLKLQFCIPTGNRLSVVCTTADCMPASKRRLAQRLEAWGWGVWKAGSVTPPNSKWPAP